MKHKRKKISKKLGLKPGSVVYVGKERTDPVRLSAIDYTGSEHKELIDLKVEKVTGYKDTPTVTWIMAEGIHEAAVVESLGQALGIHPLVLEDIVNTGHRPKFEDSPEYIFITLKMLKGFDDEGALQSEQVSVVFGRQWVISFRESADETFEPVRQRIIKTVPRERFMNSDYLAYALVDAVVDRYFVLLEQVGERIDVLDDEVSENPETRHLDEIRSLKKQLISMRKAIWPLREVIGAWDRLESDLVKASTAPYLRDVYEHVIQVIDTVETYRDMVSGLLEVYHTGISNRMNEVMKVLTIFASVFIPLGFLAGVYGMNFDTAASPFNLPELGFRYGYLMFWGAVAAIGGGLFWFFRRRKWI